MIAPKKLKSQAAQRRPATAVSSGHPGQRRTACPGTAERLPFGVATACDRGTLRCRTTVGSDTDGAERLSGGHIVPSTTMAAHRVHH